jgi:hypothetical protein
LRELCRNPAFGDFLGEDSGPQSRRLRPVKAGDFDSRPKTPAKEFGLPNLFFTRVVQTSVAPPESLKRHFGDSEVFAPGSWRLRSLQAEDSGWHRRLRTPKSRDSEVSRPQRLDLSEGYKQSSSTFGGCCGFYSLSSSVAKLQSPRSSILATRT